MPKSIFSFLIVLSLIYGVSYGCGHVDSDTIILGMQYKVNWSFESAILSDNLKAAYPDSFVLAKNEFDDHVVIQRLSPLLQPAKDKILSTHFLKRYAASIDTFDFTKDRFRILHAVTVLADTMITIANGGAWHFKKRFASHLRTNSSEHRSMWDMWYLEEFFTPPTLDSARRISEYWHAATQCQHDAYFSFPFSLLEFSFVSASGKKGLFIIPHSLIFIDTSLHEVLRLPFPMASSAPINKTPVFRKSQK